VALPSSRVAPVNACPDLRPRWCPGPMAMAVPGLLPCAHCKASAFTSPLTGGGYPSDHNYTYFGAQWRGLHPCSIRLRTNHYWNARGFRYWPAGSALTRWDLEPSAPHPLGNINEFPEASSFPDVSGLSWHEQRFVRRIVTLKLHNSFQKTLASLP